MSTNESGFVGTREAAEMLGFSPMTLAVWRCKGRGPKWHKIGGRVKYRLSDIENFLNECKRPAQAKTE